MKSNVLPRLLLANWISALAFAETVIHDESFWPDHVLRVSIAEVPSGCESREDVVVNGTSPGPTIHLLAGVRSWIRVYNDMVDQNLTMVSLTLGYAHARPD
jgi:L-ascorbate oxidase